MKKLYRIISILLVLLFPISLACAETIDLSNLSYDELLELRRQVDFAIAETREWKQVVIPVGKYVVGVDIPAGDYSVVYDGGFQSMLGINDANGKPAATYLLGDVYQTKTIGKITLTDGMSIAINYGALIFAPYKGLGF